MDEEDLLLDAVPCDISSLGEVDEAAVLGDDVVPEVSNRKESIEEKEELDYDEDLDDETEKTPRSSKFASERVDHRRHSMKSVDVSPERGGAKHRKISHGSQNVISRASGEATTVVSQMPSAQKQGRVAPKVLVNPHYRGGLSAQQGLLNWGGVKHHPASIPSKIHLQPSLPPAVASVSPQMPPAAMPYMAIPSSSADFSKPPPVVPLTNFAAPPPAYPMSYSAPPQQNIIPPADQWDQMVEGFLRRTAVQPRSLRRYSRSRSRTSSSSSRSRSRSYSSRSSSFSESSRSSRSSRRGSRSRGRRSSSRRSESRRLRRRSRSRSRRDYGRVLPDKRGDRMGRYDDRRGQDRRKGFYPDPNNQEKTIECAKAIGLDSEYLSKLEEQKRMREEILRKKEERRFQNVQKMGDNNSAGVEKNGRSYQSTGSSKRLENAPERSVRSVGGSETVKGDKRYERVRSNEKSLSKSEGRNDGKDSRNSWKTSASDEKLVIQVNPRKIAEALDRNSNGSIRPSASEQDIRRAQMAHIRASEQNAQASSARSSSNAAEKGGRKKAYLAVVITAANRGLPDLERMKLVASTVGPTKKVWVSSDDTVSVIFESHDSAKQFVFKYNGKAINGVALRISLQKVFANLAEL